MKLEKSLAAWGSETFAATLKAELEAFSPDRLGLQKAANWPLQLDAPVTVSVMDVQGNAAQLYAQVGVFFTETIAGCNCADAPMERPAYAELGVAIDGKTAEMTLTLLG
ncbi:MAG: glucosamine--fructose-6-phosphate aminotransferase [Betaproteobacteria bacterium]|nr:glucosamine--fructose-6-phosphate aminotransferase [Betaproteobacteria bacterium]